MVLLCSFDFPQTSVIQCFNLFNQLNKHLSSSRQVQSTRYSLTFCLAPLVSCGKLKQTQEDHWLTVTRDSVYLRYTNRLKDIDYHKCLSSTYPYRVRKCIDTSGKVMKGLLRSEHIFYWIDTCFYWNVSSHTSNFWTSNRNFSMFCPSSANLWSTLAASPIWGFLIYTSFIFVKASLRKKTNKKPSKR